MISHELFTYRIIYLQNALRHPANCPTFLPVMHTMDKKQTEKQKISLCLLFPLFALTWNLWIVFFEPCRNLQYGLAGNDCRFACTLSELHEFHAVQPEIAIKSKFLCQFNAFFLVWFDVTESSYAMLSLQNWRLDVPNMAER